MRLATYLTLLSAIFFGIALAIPGFLEGSKEGEVQSLLCGSEGRESCLGLPLEVSFLIYTSLAPPSLPFFSFPSNRVF